MQRQIYLSLRSEFSDFLSILLCLSFPRNEIIIATHTFTAQNIAEYNPIAEAICEAAASVHWRLL
jgi:hypothetical protein